jgi:hypothetical protein
MHIKTRTYLNEAVIVRSTGCDISHERSLVDVRKNEILSSYSRARDLVEMRWQLCREWSHMWKPVMFWRLDLCSLCSTRVLRLTRLSRRARHTLFCGCFAGSVQTFRQKMTGHHQISWRRRILYIIKNIDLRAAYVYVFWIRNSSAIWWLMRYLLHFTKVHFPQYCIRAVIDAPLPTRTFGS